MLLAYKNRCAPPVDDIPPIVESNIVHYKTHSQQPVDYHIIDTSGPVEEQLDPGMVCLDNETMGQSYRILYLTHTNFYILCFSVVDRTSFMNIKQWHDWATHYVYDAKFLLVGTKADLRGESNDYITMKEARTLSENLNGCVDYLECSAKLQQGLHEIARKVFSVEYPLLEQKKKCYIM